MKQDHYCVVMHRGKVLDNMYFDNVLVAAYYYSKKYKIEMYPLGKNRELRIKTGELNTTIIRIPLEKKLVTL